ncbi:MAG: class I SAM-dependent methyltransferase [Acidimicrobiia bacterium]|nr:class I SAM-dependent methyltransferase [Acidimicrobiia bacterium]
MTRARPPAVGVGVDPVPRLHSPVAIECHIYPQRSEDFFARPDLDTLFTAGPPDLVFIDGLHTFPAVLGDLAGAEAISRADTIIVLHDTIPLDEPTQRPDQQHAFYTGDVWKLLPCLAEVRPDLQVFTVLAPPSGLTFIAGLDPTSTVLTDRHDELVERFGSLPFDPDAVLYGELVPNDWPTVRARLGG